MIVYLAVTVGVVIEGAYVWRLDMYPPVPEYVEPTGDPIVSEPLQWVEVVEEVSP